MQILVFHRNGSPLLLLLTLWILFTLSFLASSARANGILCLPQQTTSRPPATLASSVFTIQRGNDESFQRLKRHLNIPCRVLDIRGGGSQDHIVEDDISKEKDEEPSKADDDDDDHDATTTNTATTTTANHADTDSIKNRKDSLLSNSKEEQHTEQDIISKATNRNGRTMESQSDASSDVENDHVEVPQEDFKDVQCSSSSSKQSASIDVEVVIQSENEQNDQQEQIQDFVNDIQVIQNSAAELRVKAKKFHDEGDFSNASDTFQQAASELDGAISRLNTCIPKNDELSKKIIEERATCRLHEALCHLKNKKYVESVMSCTTVLMDGVEVIVLEDQEEDEEEEEEEDINHGDVDDGGNKIPMVQIYSNHVDSLSSSSTSTLSLSSSSGTNVALSPAIRARAYHRRAKARLALGDRDGALDDSRSAAFLGDRNAVALYGRLMRESGKGGSGSSNPWLNNHEGGSSNTLMDGYGLFGGDNTNGSPLDALFSGSSLFSDSHGSDNGNSSGSAMDLFGSLLNNSSGNGSSMDTPSMPFLNPLGLLGSMNGSNGGPGDSGMEGLAKSVLSSVAKKAEDKETQEMICKYLNSVDSTQLMGLSTMAGVPLSQSTAERIVSFAKSVTPRGIGKSVKLTKRILFVGSLMRKTFKIIGKYKHLIVLAVLVGWIKSAIQRPVVTAVKKQSAKQVLNAALSKSRFYI